MSKYDQYNQYPSRGLSAAETVLLSVWPTLARHHDDVVLVGGLAVHYLTRGQNKAWPGAITMDVDLGVSLVVDDDRYGNIMDDMRGLGFLPDTEIGNRLVREVDGLKMYLDFMTASGKKLSLNDTQRRSLAKKGKRLGWADLQKYATLVTPSTLRARGIIPHPNEANAPIGSSSSARIWK